MAAGDVRMSFRGIATGIFSFLVLAVISSIISANIRTYASKRGHDTYLDRFADHPQVINWCRRMIAGWQPLQRRWWLWLALGLSGGLSAALWVMPSPEIIRALPPQVAPPLAAEPQPPRRYTAYEKEQRLRAIDEIYNVFATQISPAFAEGHTMLINLVSTIGDGTPQRLSDHAKNVETAFNNLSGLLKKWEYHPDIVQVLQQKPMFNGLNETNASKNMISTIELFKSAVQPSYFTQLLDRDMSMFELRSANQDFEIYLKKVMPALKQKRTEIESSQVLGDK
ncbi:hypothetical protein SAMN05444159_7295 [Bradyrhizobium lablabi]|uniref:Uncharacterized protein n=1 Tax=Bradyrhizobium lablabi TaxID=722472 RepID=A0A1M7EVR8_9BRAD|nr:hypothetical protein [Bradyrhizobium lablabi]SHL95864.1 hypothetical protein SAMN05444159_7295 [Bradyrhizobium lablabi]